MLIVLAVAKLACTSEAPPRGQLLVVFDTDVPALGQLATRPELSNSATVDALRIDVLDANDRVVATQELALPEETAYPLSFGVTQELAGRVTVRARLFRSLLARRDANGRLEPEPELAIDRLASEVVPAEGVRTVRLRIRGDCFGRSASFLTRTSCIDAARLDAPITEGFEIEPNDPRTTAVGTWPGASSIPCSETQPPKTRCVEGGVSIIGDPATRELGAQLPAFPAFIALVSPFFMDETEMSVGSLRALFNAGKVKGEPARKNDGSFQLSEYCTWLGPNDPANDDLPVNCITFPEARSACRALGGDLPTEAQWEHAARGRGRLYTYPWGEALSTCCRASVDRLRRESECAPESGFPIERVGSHRPVTSFCEDLGDQSRDNILDLGGSMREWTRGAALGYADPCWGVGLRIDPLCEGTATEQFVARGGNWQDGSGNARSAFRSAHVAERVSKVGFRCVYPARQE